jgi:cation diffusion facilitator CzcD-associated flavoprotein CzcO
VRNETRLTLIEPLADHIFRLHVSGAGAPAARTLLARKVVLATGIQGGGEWHVPPFIADNLPRSRYAHTSEPIDFAAMQGRKIGILGGGASAFDNAQHGLGLGVGEMHVFMRRKELPRINPIRYMENAGFLGHFAALDDATKYAAMSYFLRLNQPPTNDTFNRAASYPGFRLHLGAPWLAVADTASGVTVTTPAGDYVFDFVILSTGLVTDAKLRPELALVADDIALWQDRYIAPAGEANALVDQHPYLGPSFELTPRTPEAAARLHGLFALNYSALVSLGLSASALSGMKFALPRLVQGIARQLFMDDKPAILRDYYAYSEEEFVGKWPAG